MSCGRLLFALIVAITCMADVWGQPPGRRPRGFRPMDVNLILMSMDDVQRELEITREQEQMLEALAEDFQAQRRGRRRRDPSMAQQRIATSSKLFKVVLDKDQSERLEQLKLQFEGPYAIADEQFAKDVGLTDDHLAAIRDARREKMIDVDSLAETIGERPLKKWRQKLGESYEFSDELVEFRRDYQRRRRISEIENRRRQRPDTESE